MTEPVAKSAKETAALLHALADMIDAYGMPAEHAEPEPVIPRSQSTLAPLDMATIHPAVTKRELHITKIDEDQQLVFGWASIANTADGNPIVDSQSDIIEPAELENAVYKFMQEYSARGAGELHKGDPVGRIVESVILTPQKMAAMGIDHAMPTGWWIGMKVDDAAVFEKVKSGRYRMFSIQGRAVRHAA